MTPCILPAAFLQFLKESNTIYGSPAVRTSEIPQTVKSLWVKFFQRVFCWYALWRLLSFQTVCLVFHGKELCLYHCFFFFLFEQEFCENIKNKTKQHIFPFVLGVGFFGGCADGFFVCFWFRFWFLDFHLCLHKPSISPLLPHCYQVQI